MTDNAAALPRKGDWVKVWALVTDADPHPGEYLVRLESHNEHYAGLVRRDHVEVTAEVPSFVDRCSSLYEVTIRLDGLRPHIAEVLEEGDEVLLRCTKPVEHSGRHKHRGMKWTDAEAYDLE